MDPGIFPPACVAMTRDEGLDAKVKVPATVEVVVGLALVFGVGCVTMVEATKDGVVWMTASEAADATEDEAAEARIAAGVETRAPVPLLIMTMAVCGRRGGSGDGNGAADCSNGNAAVGLMD